MFRYARSGRPMATFAAAGLLAIFGCGGDDSGLPKRYPVTGTVTYNNEPVPKGTVVFEPTNMAAGGIVAAGSIENGKYTLSTSGAGADGALPGEYKVCIIAKDTDMSAVEANRNGGAGRQDDVFKAEKKAKALVPKKYLRTDTSGLTAKVEEKSNTVDFPLTD